MVIILTLFVTEYTNFIIIQATVGTLIITYCSTGIVAYRNSSHWVAAWPVIPVDTKVKHPIKLIFV